MSDTHATAPTAQPTEPTAPIPTAGVTAQMGPDARLVVSMPGDMLAQMRARHLDSFDQSARLAKFSPGSPGSATDPASFTDEARQVWLAKFDKAAQEDGLMPVAPPAADVVQAHANFGLPIDVKPSDYRPVYNPDFAASLPAARLVLLNTELTTWAAETGFQAAAGTAVIELLSELGPRLIAMDQDQRAAWQDSQERLALQTLKTPEAVAKLKEQAKAALGIAKGNPFSKAVLSSLHLSDFRLLLALAAHGQKVEGFAAMYPKLRKDRA
jgi:hypothetical protein